MSKSDYFLNKVLGEDFLEDLAKTEIYKMGTKSVNDINDMAIGLKIVPRTIISWLTRELAPMSIGENKELSIPVPGNFILRVTKQERDQFSGDIIEDSKVISNILYRSIPAIGILLLSTFELYPTEELIEEKESLPDDLSSKVQKLVDERLALHDLIGKVVDKKIAQKEAIKHLVLRKLTQSIELPKPVAPIIHLPIIPPTPIAVEGSPKKISKFREFMNRKKKPKEFSIEMSKSEVYCPDCGNNIFNGKTISGCICYGNSGKVHLKKTDKGIKVRFGRNWDPESIEMLLEVLRDKNEKT